jgi:hypothetical protein
LFGFSTGRSGLVEDVNWLEFTGALATCVFRSNSQQQRDNNNKKKKKTKERGVCGTFIGASLPRILASFSITAKMEGLCSGSETKMKPVIGREGENLVATSSTSQRMWITNQFVELFCVWRAGGNGPVVVQNAQGTAVFKGTLKEGNFEKQNAQGPNVCLFVDDLLSEQVTHFRGSIGHRRVSVGCEKGSITNSADGGFVLLLDVLLSDVSFSLVAGIVHSGCSASKITDFVVSVMNQNVFHLSVDWCFRKETQFVCL